MNGVCPEPLPHKQGLWAYFMLFFLEFKTSIEFSGFEQFCFRNRTQISEVGFYHMLSVYECLSGRTRTALL